MASKGETVSPAYAAARDLASAAAAVLEEPDRRPRHQEYLVDNSALQSSARGLAYRLSKNLADKDLGQLAEWGSTVIGLNEGDGWISVGSRYLPFSVENSLVLLPVSPVERELPDQDLAELPALPEEFPEQYYREPKPLEGSVVEVFGRAGKPTRTVPQEGVEAEEVNVEGQQGLCIGWLEEEQSYVVHTFEGQLVAVAPESLRAWNPPPAEEGGFDVPWMGDAPNGEYFAAAVCDTLGHKGYCVIQTYVGAREREEALESAEEGREFRRMKQELESAYLGIDNNTKIASLWPADAAGVASDPEVELEREASEEVGPEAVLHACSRQMTDLGVLLSSWAPLQLGFACHGLMSTMVRTSIDRTEEDELFPESIQDVEDEAEAGGLVEGFVRFASRRKLGLVSMIDNQGGDLWFYPKGQFGPKSVHIPITPNKLVVFRHDLMDYSYQVVGPSLALQTWVLDAPLNQVMINNMQVDLDASSDLRQVVTNPAPVKAEGPKASIMGISVRNSGECWSPEHWWNMFVACTDCDVKWPAVRWETEPYYEEGGDAILTGKSYTCHGGFLSQEQITQFDNNFFDIPEAEAATMLPGQRLVMEVGYACLYKSGYRRDTLRGSRIGMWLGDVGPDWSSWQTEWARFLGDVCPSTLATSMANICTANRISHIFDMKGPTSSYDTACSSSLIALNAAHAAMFRQKEAGRLTVPRGLNDGGMVGEDCKEALVGGVNTLLGPGSYVGNCMGNMLTHKGRCFTFTDSADGYQRADASGMLFCKLFEGDQEDVDRRICSLVGTCANADGKSASLTAPSGPAQQKLLRKSLDFAGIDPGSVSYAECHGTGTSLGDPIEVGAMQAVMCTNRELPVIVGSHKSNTGHSEAAAGISGLTKCILFLAMQAVPPNVHFNTLNPNIAIEGYPAYFTSEAVDTGFSESFCGVSSFGFGGSNARADVFGHALRGPREMLQLELPRVNFPRELPIGQPVYVCGSWSGWSAAEQMEGGRHGAYKCCVSLGASGREEFFLTCDREGSLSSGDKRPPATFHPLVPGAGRGSQVVGPDVQSKNLYFLIDGAADGVRSGTVYEIEFEWTEDKKSVSWSPIESPDSEELAVLGTEFEHRYYLAGSFLRSGELQELELQEDGSFEASFRMGVRSQEQFHIVCDRDKRQLIYPETAQTSKGGGEVFGPNDMRGDRSWLVRGPVHQAVAVRLDIAGGEISVTVTSPKMGTQRWGS